TADGGRLSLAGGAVGASTDCLVTYPISAAVTGSYSITSSAVSGLSNLVNAIGTRTVTIVPTPQWQTTGLENMTVGRAASQQLAATGLDPLSYQVVDGDLPDGVTLAASGALTGTPARAGAYSVTVRATAQVGTADRVFTGTV